MESDRPHHDTTNVQGPSGTEEERSVRRIADDIHQITTRCELLRWRMLLRDDVPEDELFITLDDLWRLTDSATGRTLGIGWRLPYGMVKAERFELRLRAALLQLREGIDAARLLPFDRLPLDACASTFSSWGLPRLSRYAKRLSNLATREVQNAALAPPREPSGLDSHVASAVQRVVEGLRAMCRTSVSALSQRGEDGCSATSTDEWSRLLFDTEDCLEVVCTLLSAAHSGPHEPNAVTCKAIAELTEATLQALEIVSAVDPEKDECSYLDDGEQHEFVRLCEWMEMAAFGTTSSDPLESMDDDLDELLADASECLRLFAAMDREYGLASAAAGEVVVEDPWHFKNPRDERVFREACERFGSHRKELLGPLARVLRWGQERGLELTSTDINILADEDANPDHQWDVCDRCEFNVNQIYEELHAERRSRDGDPVVKETSTASIGQSIGRYAAEPVVPGRSGDPCYVNGREKPSLTHAGYAVVSALLEAGDEGLSKDALESVRASGRRILKKLSNDPDWAEVIVMPGQTNGRYRIRP